MLLKEPDHRMRILVLGFTGYLGGHVVEHLRALPGARVFGGGRSPHAELDIDLATARTDGLAKTLASAAPDAVINCAGSTDGDAVTSRRSTPWPRRPVRGAAGGSALGPARPATRWGPAPRPPGCQAGSPGCCARPVRTRTR